jgi:hypothetical protein
LQLLEIPDARMFDNEITQHHQGTSPVTPLTLNKIETDTLYGYQEYSQRLINDLPNPFDDPISIKVKSLLTKRDQSSRRSPFVSTAIPSTSYQSSPRPEDKSQLAGNSAIGLYLNSGLKQYKQP